MLVERVKSLQSTTKHVVDCKDLTPIKHQTTRARLAEKGMVLVIVMLFLVVISLLALDLLNTSLLETKMSSYYQNKARAFYLAEESLAQYEQEVLSGRQGASAKVIDSNICGVTFYRVTASVRYNGAQSKLQSTVAKVDTTTHCDPKPNIKQGRQSFLVLD